MIQGILFLLALVLPCDTLMAVGEGGHHLNGITLELYWVMPFLGILLSLALMPIMMPRFWHGHYGKVALFWSLITFGAMIAFFSLDQAKFEIFYTLFHHYVPFIILVGALYIITLDIKIEFGFVGTPTNNALFMMCGALIASVIGTTGASMVLIQPLLRINQNRLHKKHLIIFFIFIVSNIGGSLTPLGDPPLFLGFLEGVPFSWPLIHLIGPLCFVLIPLLFVLWGLDHYFMRKEKDLPQKEKKSASSKLIKVSGYANILLLGLVVLTILLSGLVSLPYGVTIFNVHLKLTDLLRDGVLLCLIGIALCIKRRRGAEAVYTWGPLLEVAKLFAAIFITAIPVIAILKAGEQGALSFLTTGLFAADEPLNMRFFWITGLLSGFLDNAPTYLIFFHLAGGDAEALTTTLKTTLIAISSGAVFMGALSYIGNAPNFMVKAIAEENGVVMPSFFGYMGWSLLCLIPLMLGVSFFWFM
ncbi:MAG: sodium:proton antiporter [Candidatus Nucleicultricaceae bacterium]